MIAQPDDPEPSREPSNETPDRPAREKRRAGQVIREAVLLSAPTIIIVYPLVGFGLGYLAVKLWNWPLWVAIVTLLMGFVQGMREVYRLGKKIE